MADTTTKEATRATVEETHAAKEAKELAKVDIPPVITTGDQYDRVYKYLVTRYHMLTPVAAFSGMAPQHGIVVAKVLLDSDPDHGEVYQDKLFCRHSQKDPLDDEVAIAKVGLRRLAIAGGWNLSADVLKADRNYWVLKGHNRFIGLDGAVQTFSATEEYDLRDGSPQVRSFTPRQLEAARAHGLRGGEARALNAACREFGIRQKYTRRELLKPFAIMRMMFIPDASNELQMRIVTERALQGTGAMFPQQTHAPMALEPIDGLSTPIDVGSGVSTPPAAKDAHTKPATDGFLSALPPGYTLIVKINEEEKKRRSGEGTFKKWTVTDAHGDVSVTIKKDLAKALMTCWNQQDWKKGRPVEISTQPNSYNELEITEVNALSTSPDEEPSISQAD